MSIKGCVKEDAQGTSEGAAEKSGNSAKILAAATSSMLAAPGARGKSNRVEAGGAFRPEGGGTMS